MVISNLSKREKLILLLCAAVIISAIFYNFILEPFIRGWIGLNEDIDIMRLKLRKAEEILRRRLEIMEQYKALSSFITPERKRGSDEEEMTLLLSEVEKLANSSNVIITDIKPGQAKDTGYYRRYMVEVESEGDISRFTKFIYEIQNSPQLLKIEKLSLNMKRGGDNLLNGQMVITKILP